ncbi:MAG: SRPBCC family protein [Bacteroidetes bacterium]|nr:SRPBCC family protein [Bacteroidota bacterium]MBS1973903.1 SRPBCC family protein [Bacteroidota bacterium]
MRLLRLVIISIIILFIIFTCISFFIPSHISIAKAIDIKAPRQQVHDALNDLKAWDKWNWFTAHSSLSNKTYSAPSYGKGAMMKSDQLNIEITDSKPDSIKTDWAQLRGKHFNAVFVIAEIQPGETAVQWYFDFHFRWYPWEKFSVLLYNSQIGGVMDESLSGLKRFAENNP